MATNPAGCARSIALVALLGSLVAGCASSPPGSYPEGHGVGAYRVGAPYRINGVWYYPAIDYNYDRTGVASWYGEQFEGRLTANGEIFDLNELTAAHTTLPMPSIVQVTNLQNGRSLQLRVNDRGPFRDRRLIDVSRRAAQLLGFERQGTTLARVTVLKDESIAAAEEAMRNSGRVMVAQVSHAAPLSGPVSRPVYASAAAPLQGGAASPAPQLVERRPPPQVAMAATKAQQPTITALSQPVAAARTSEEPTRNPAPVIAMLPPEPSPLQPPALPPRPARSRFALIAPAEAAELPPPRVPARRPEIPPSAANPKTSPVPQKAVAARGGPRREIFVQAGAFSMRNNAERVQSRIARLGNVQVMPASVNGAAMYRVRIGPLVDDEQARRLLARVVDDGYPGARIVGN